MFILIGSYLSSIGISFIIKFNKELKIYKYSADNGYKVSNKTFFNNLSSKFNKKAIITLLIPFYNLVNTIIESKSDFLKCDFEDDKAFNPMSSYEDELYKQHPNSINAILVPMIVQKELEESFIYEIFDENGYSKFHYFVDENNDLHICKVEGYAENLSLNEQTTLMIIHLFKDELDNYNHENNVSDYNFPNNCNLTLKRTKK